MANYCNNVLKITTSDAALMKRLVAIADPPRCLS